MLSKTFSWIVMILVLAYAIPGIASGDKMMQQQNKGEKQLQSLFLISGKLPHLMKPIKKYWDDPDFGLTPGQKEKLSAVQKANMEAVNMLKKELPPLEDKVKQGVLAGKTADELSALVDQVASLKTKGTMTHLRCIQEVKSILTKEQFAKIMNQMSKK